MGTQRKSISDQLNIQGDSQRIHKQPIGYPLIIYNHFIGYRYEVHGVHTHEYMNMFVYIYIYREREIGREREREREREGKKERDIGHNRGCIENL
jgi:hypothetical protein